MHGDDHDQAGEVLDGELMEHPPAAPARRDPPSGSAPLTPPAGPSPGLVWARTPAAQNAMAAATGFVAGAATLALARRYGRARLERTLAATESDKRLFSPSAPLGAGRTYLVHVRELGAERPIPVRPTVGLPPTLGPGTSVE